MAEPTVKPSASAAIAAIETRAEANLLELLCVVFGALSHPTSKRQAAVNVARGIFKQNLSIVSKNEMPDVSLIKITRLQINGSNNQELALLRIISENGLSTAILTEEK
jgi:hypothetical protein